MRTRTPHCVRHDNPELAYEPCHCERCRIHGAAICLPVLHLPLGSCRSRWKVVTEAIPLPTDRRTAFAMTTCQQMATRHKASRHDNPELAHEPCHCEPQQDFFAKPLYACDEHLHDNSYGVCLSAREGSVKWLCLQSQLKRGRDFSLCNKWFYLRRDCEIPPYLGRTFKMFCMSQSSLEMRRRSVATRTSMSISQS